MIQIINGDCLEVMKKIPENSIDSIITDPPYGLSFMNKDWDHGIPGKHFWDEALRVAKPGSHMLAFGGTRTHHRLMCAIEDAGWEVRDCLGWLYGSGFPKSHNIGKAVDKMKGVEREVIGHNKNHREIAIGGDYGNVPMLNLVSHGDITTPTTNEAKQWDGWGSALKPAWEPIILARKPLNCTIAENVLKWGTGGINIDGCRVESDEDMSNMKSSGSMSHYTGWSRPWMSDKQSILDKQNKAIEKMKDLGRFPANIIHDGSDEVVSLFPNESSRFFYCAKASSAERNKGLDDCESYKVKDGRTALVDNPFQRGETLRKNTHPTVKPIKLLRYLCKLITPPGGLIMDPFAGSGSTGLAAKEENLNCVMIDISSEYCEIAMRRNGLSEIYC